jgi:hypothetical protein
LIAASQGQAPQEHLCLQIPHMRALHDSRLSTLEWEHVLGDPAQPKSHLKHCFLRSID